MNKPPSSPPPGEEQNQNPDDPQNKRKAPPDDKFDWKKLSRTLLIWVTIIIVGWMIIRQFNLNEQSEKPVGFTQFQKYLHDDVIESAEIIDKEFHGRLKDDGKGGGSFVTILPFINQRMIETWDSLKIDYQFREKTSNWFTYLLINILPWVLIMGVWFYFLRRMQGGGAKGVFSFGKSKAKVLTEHKPRVTFKDVAGCDEAKEELTEIIAFLRNPRKFTRLGGHIPKGALLLGPPGTGKTLLARAVAGEAGVPFFSMSGADFVEMFVGVGAARVRDLFEQGKKNAPCIIFIDEIDAVGRHRGAGLGGGHDEREQTLNQLLVEMDGFESNDGVILIAATNRPDVLDPALTRPGRFDRQIVVDRPDVRGREGILKVHTREVPLGSDVKLDVLAKGTPGLAGADIANLVNEAALLAARRNANQVFMEDFENAKDKVMMGTERRSLVISDDERRQTAFHEAGHVLVAKQTPGSDPVHKVTIIPRGRALGLTHYLPIDEKHNYSRTYLTRMLIHLLGGRAAEKIVFSELSTGAGNDIARASEIARKMVTEWGMSDKIGPVAWERRSEEVFLGRDFAQHREFSERTAMEIDDEVKRILHRAEEQAEKVLRENRDKLDRIADALLDREILDGAEIDSLIENRKLPPLAKNGKLLGPQPKKPEGRPDQRPISRPPQPPQGKQEPVKESADPAHRSLSRRDFAKAYGVVSSRDSQRPRYPERRKPADSGSKPQPRQQRPQQPGAQAKPAPTTEEKEQPKIVKPVEADSTPPAPKQGTTAAGGEAESRSSRKRTRPRKKRPTATESTTAPATAVEHLPDTLPAAPENLSRGATASLTESAPEKPGAPSPVVEGKPDKTEMLPLFEEPQASRQIAPAERLSDLKPAPDSKQGGEPVAREARPSHDTTGLFSHKPKPEESESPKAGISGEAASKAPAAEPVTTDAREPESPAAVETDQDTPVKSAKKTARRRTTPSPRKRTTTAHSPKRTVSPDSDSAQSPVKEPPTPVNEEPFQDDAD